MEMSKPISMFDQWRLTLTLNVNIITFHIECECILEVVTLR